MKKCTVGTEKFRDHDWTVWEEVAVGMQDKKTGQFFNQQWQRRQCIRCDFIEEKQI